MNRFAKIALALAISAVSLPALADGAGHKHEEQSFPMPAAAFRQKVEQRMEKMRARVEARLTEKKAPEAKVAEVRAKMAAAETAMRTVLDKVTADGTVTKDEAKEVRAVAKSFKPEHKKGGEAKQGS